MESIPQSYNVLNTNNYTVYIDGSCKKNPGGSGGFGVIVLSEPTQRLLWGDCGVIPAPTTNNRAELIAAIYGVSLFDTGSTLTIYSDSQYLVKGMNHWLCRWKKRNFKQIKNVDLWKELDCITQSHTIEWIWIKGHCNDYYNTLVDSWSKHTT